VIENGDLKLGELQRTPLVTQIAERLRALIIDGTIPPGMPLHQAKVASQLGVSRTPLREALRILEQDGFVRIASATGTVEVVRLTAEDAVQLYELREVIDGLAARLAARRSLTAEAERELRQLVEQILRSVRPLDSRSFLQAHNAFHLAIMAASGNTWMSRVESIVRVSSHMLYSILQTGPERLLASADEHVAILDAIARGDEEGAEYLAREHIRRARAFWPVDWPAESPRTPARAS
jgi:GntR family transcriptional regulator of vanillate catabolism